MKYDGNRRRHRLGERGFMHRRRYTSNHRKCEITAKKCDIINKFPIFKNFKRGASEDKTLLEAPVLQRRASDNAWKDEGQNCYPSKINRSSVQPRSLRRSLFTNELYCNAETSLYPSSISMRQQSSLHEFDLMLNAGLEPMFNVQLV